MKWHILGAISMLVILLGTVLSSPLVLRDLQYLIDWWTR